MQHFSHPIPDMSVIDHADYERILARIRDEMDTGRIVPVHCWGGKGRTCTVIGCLLIVAGLDYESTIARIAKLSRSHRFRCMRCWPRVPVALPKARQIRHHSSDSPTPTTPISKAGTTSGRGRSSMRGPTAGWLRAVAVLTLVATVALPTPEKAGADPGATDVITVAAVDANGLPANGYQVLDRQSWPNPLTCPGPSPAAVGNNIYSCEPSSAIAEVCWPAPGSVLCVSDPWTKALRRFPSPGALPAVEPPATPMPFALLLDDGTRCVLPHGGAWGGRADGLVPAYGCGLDTWSLGVLIRPDLDPVLAIDRSQPLWRVHIGQLGPPDAAFQPPRQRTVTTAWFAGNAAG